MTNPAVTVNPLVELGRFGQSPWYDNIRRSLITSGELRGFVEKDGLKGVTSNPAIFEKAIAIIDIDITRGQQMTNPAVSVNPLVELGRFGQSPWYDNIRRSLITSGELRR